MSQQNLRICIAALVCVVVFVAIKFLDTTLALAGTAVVGLVQALYVATTPTQRPSRKPRLAWFPKYRFNCSPSSSILQASDPSQALSARLGDLGFTVKKHQSQSTQFTRGHPKGDFVIELAKLNLTVSLPVQESTTLVLEYGWVCLFDTGDLWKFSEELKRKLQE